MERDGDGQRVGEKEREEEKEPALCAEKSNLFLFSQRTDAYLSNSQNLLTNRQINA